MLYALAANVSLIWAFVGVRTPIVSRGGDLTVGQSPPHFRIRSAATIALSAGKDSEDQAVVKV